MKINPYFLFITLCAFLLSSFTFDEWRLVEAKEGISVFHKVDSSKKSWTKLETEINAPINKILDFTADIENFTNWVYACNEARTLEQRDNVTYYYTVTDLPYPLSDRDIIIKRVVDYNKKTGVYKSTSTVDDTHKIKSDHVRITEYAGFWSFIPISPTRTKLVYEVHVNPGGNIPVWIQDMVSTKGPFKTMHSLKSRF